MKQIPSVYVRENFKDRVNHAVTCISRNQGTGTRTFSTCFEMNDGDAVITAIFRRSKRNARLGLALARNVGLVNNSVVATAERYDRVPTEKLPVLAELLRKNWDEAQAYVATFSSQVTPVAAT